MEVVNKFISSLIPPHTLYDLIRWADLAYSVKLWSWLVVGLFLILIAVGTMLCRPVSLKKTQHLSTKPVTSEEIFDRVLELKIPVGGSSSEIIFSARA